MIALNEVNAQHINHVNPHLWMDFQKFKFYWKLGLIVITVHYLKMNEFVFSKKIVISVQVWCKTLIFDIKQMPSLWYVLTCQFIWRVVIKEHGGPVCDPIKFVACCLSVTTTTWHGRCWQHNTNNNTEYQAKTTIITTSQHCC